MALFHVSIDVEKLVEGGSSSGPRNLGSGRGHIGQVQKLSFESTGIALQEGKAGGGFYANMTLAAQGGLTIYNLTRVSLGARVLWGQCLRGGPPGFLLLQDVSASQTVVVKTGRGGLQLGGVWVERRWMIQYPW